VKGWICEVKTGDGVSAMRSMTLKVIGNKMRVEGMGWGNEVFLLDADAKATYTVATRRTPASLNEEASAMVTAEKYPWFSLDRKWRTGLDDAVQTQRMRSRVSDASAQDRDAAEVLAKAVEAQKKPATLEPTEETKKFGDYDCVLYNLAQGDKVKGVVWVAKGLKVDSRVWTMVGHLLDLSMGGIPVLQQLDGMEAGFPIRVNLDYTGFEMGGMSDRKLNFWIEKVSQADLDPTDVQVPRGAQVSEPVR
jgi:hypothetical protein